GYARSRVSASSPACHRHRKSPVRCDPSSNLQSFRHSMNLSRRCAVQTQRARLVARAAMILHSKRSLGRSARMSRPDYRPFLPTPAQSKIAGPTARAHAEVRRQSPRGKEFVAQWKKLVAEPFKGITADGSVVPNLYTLEPNGAPTAAMVYTARHLVGAMNDSQRTAACFPVD